MLGVVVVTFNSEKWLARCLEPWIEELGSAHVVVVDNASSDASFDIARRLGCSVIEAGSNLGYGRAANLGIRQLLIESDVDWILVLNPDTTCTAPDTVPRLLGDLLTLSDETQIVLPLLDASEGRNVHVNLHPYPGPAAALWMILPVGPPRPPRHLGTDSLRTHYPVGSFVLMRRELWISTGGFDESYALYGEDADLALRVRRTLDGEHLAAPLRVRVQHFGNATLETTSKLQLDLLFASIWLFNCRYRSHLAAVSTATIFVLGYVARAIRTMLLADVATSRSHLRVANCAFGSMLAREAALPAGHDPNPQAGKR